MKERSKQGMRVRESRIWRLAMEAGRLRAEMIVASDDAFLLLLPYFVAGEPVSLRNSREAS